MRDSFYKAFTAFVIFFTFFSAVVFAQSDADTYKKISEIENTAQRITALKEFLVNFPSSVYRMNVNNQLFTDYLNEGKTDSALIYAHMTVKRIPSMARFNLYNNIAFQLAKKKTGLDTAAVYAQRAVEAVRSAGMQNLGKYLNTQALVLYELGNADSALSLEKAAITGHEKDPDLLNNLSIFEYAVGHKTEAITKAAKAILYGNTSEALTNFNKWIKAENPREKRQNKLKEIIVDKILKNYMVSLNPDEKTKGKSYAALFLANIGVNLAVANKWAKEAASGKNLSAEEKVLYTKNFALLFKAENKIDEEIKELNSVKSIADPWDVDFWNILGSAYEKIGNSKKAINAYLTGAMGVKNRNALNKLSLTDSDIQSRIKAMMKEKESFNPGHYKNSSKNKGEVVLAELFTGAECPPCAAADYAFDALSEYYPRSMFVILEYHIHIPAPDPMTNPDTFKRYLYYGGNFGTPTAIFEGKDKITGGGAKYLAENRFNVYRFEANKYFAEKPIITISGSAKNDLNIVKVNLKIKENKKVDKGTNLHVALVEKSLNYPGGNGVTKNIFVVRDLLKGANGSPMKFKNGLDKLDVSFNLKEIEQNLTNYLNDPEKYPSWQRGLPFSGWKQKPDKLNKNNLAVVAWVQNNQNKEVLQALYLSVPGSN